ncbi:MAG: uroporphyrinogen decarboxylase family protein [Kiritimatiellia bacterium]|nr:hypothetical protein [Lentisphaerota bacterium]
MTPSQDNTAGIVTEKKPASPYDIRNGHPANGLVWGLETFGSHQPPSDDNFHTRNGRQFLRSSSCDKKSIRQKDRSPGWYKTEYENIRYTETEDGEHDVFTWQTPVGTVTGRRHENHFNEYPVKSMEDLNVWNYVHSHMHFSRNAEWLKKRDEKKIDTIGLNWSPVQQLLQFDIGVENFYYFLMDAPDAMATLLNTMQERCLERLQLGLSLFPSASNIYWGENTSSSMISPAYYRQLTLPHIRAYARLAHQHNKRLNVHMCGLLRDLLDCFLLTEMDGIDSATPPPVGDTPYRLIRSKFKPDFYIMGRLNAQLWVGKDRATLQNTLREMIYPELLQTPFLLAVTSDAIPDIPRDDVMRLYEVLQNMDWQETI